MKEEKVMYSAVLCFPIQNGQVWLGRKMQKIGAGLWNGYGGGIEPGETALEAICRELLEEGRVKTWPRDLVKVAEVTFNNTKSDGSQFVCLVHVYTISFWLGQLKTTKEMADPTRFLLNAVPYEEMMPADRDWLPPVLIGQKVKAEVWYGPHQANLLKPTVAQIVDHFD